MTDRPLLTLAVITYNQAALVAEAVRGALAQTYTPLEIILSDDRSPDETFAVMQALAADYHGPHTVIVRQTPRNLGLIGHINDVTQMARGELIVIAAGDDISLPKRAERVCAEYLASGRRAHSIFSNAIWIDESGREMNLLHKQPVPPEELTLANYAARRVPALVNGATQAWSKALFDFFGPIDPSLGAEDIVLPFRAALLGEIRYIHEPLVRYRRDTTRLNARPGQSSLGKYRQEWLKWKRLTAAVQQGRLNDLDLFTARRGNTPELESIRQVVQTRRDQLRLEIDAATGVLRPADVGWKTYLHLRLKSFVTPLYEFIRLLTYYKYQDMRRMLRAK
ncbi:MAG: glycosyltransferase [Anaerolineales bacterium]